jgi:hypothetical protein
MLLRGWVVKLWIVSHYFRIGSHDETSKHVNECEDIKTVTVKITVFWDVAP